jgi:hypothetical protein
MDDVEQTDEGPEGPTEEEIAEQELEQMPNGNIHAQMVDVKNTMTEYVPMMDHATGEYEKYELEFHRIPWEQNMRMTQKAWKESGHDQHMYAFLMQVYQLKEMIVSINGVKMNESTWTNLRSDFIEAIRKTIFGESPLYPKNDAEMLKNLMGVLQDSTENGELTEQIVGANKRKTQTQHSQTSK